MKTLHEFADVHTHNPDAGDDAVICLPLFAEVPDKGYYSAGLHPWDIPSLSAEEVDRALAWVRESAAHPRVVAIGECGIDRLRGASPEMQRRVFAEHIDISESAGKPLIVHAVRSYPELMQMRRQMKPRQPWVIHGYRGNAVLARQLVRLGFGISLGRRFNAEVPAAIPADSLYHETDMDF